MSDLPKLIPITRREPPPGYRKPVYSEDVDAAPVMDAEAVMAEDEARLNEARRRAGYALQTYRWWGLTNIINTIRLWLQARRLKRAQ